MKDFIKTQISNTWSILTQLIFMMQNFDDSTNSMDKVNVNNKEEDESRDSLKQKVEEIMEKFLINYRFPYYKHPDLEWTDSDEDN